MTHTAPDLPVETRPMDLSLDQPTEADLYDRGVATLLAAWERYARGSVGATVHRLIGVAAAVFPREPERSVYNNAVLARDLAATERADAILGMETVYENAGVTRYAAWVHESDKAMRSDLERRGFTLDEVTRAMGMTLDDIRLPRPELELGAATWSEHWRIAEVHPGLLSGVDTAPFHILVAALRGENVATAIAFDHGTDCGIYNVGTLDAARRRGLGTALTTIHLHDALARGCHTASLQSTAMAERIYTAVGFRDLGRILEYVPPQRAKRRSSPSPPPATFVSNRGVSPVAGQMRFRPPRLTDAQAVLALLIERDIADIGNPDITPEDLRDEWCRNDFALSADARVVEAANGRIIGYATISREVTMLVVVAPEHEGRGIGSRLRRWAEQRDRTRGSARHRQWIAACNERGRALLLAAGYRPQRSYWRLARTLGEAGEDGTPPGVSLRPVDVDKDAQALHALNEASFKASPDYRPYSFSAFYEEHLRAHDFDRELSCLATSGGEPVGFLLARRLREENTGFIRPARRSSGPQSSRAGNGPTANRVRALRSGRTQRGPARRRLR
jgi:GNAT superfamily N-acetyltransferase